MCMMCMCGARVLHVHQWPPPRRGQALCRHRVCTACAPCHAGGHHHAEEAPLEYQRRLQSLAADQLAVVCKAMEMPDMRTI